MDGATNDAAFSSLKSVSTQVWDALGSMVEQDLLNSEAGFYAATRKLRSHRNRKKIKDVSRTQKG